MINENDKFHQNFQRSSIKGLLLLFYQNYEATKIKRVGCCRLKFHTKKKLKLIFFGKIRQVRKAGLHREELEGNSALERKLSMYLCLLWIFDAQYII